jgi:hypothetical protein
MSSLDTWATHDACHLAVASSSPGRGETEAVSVRCVPGDARHLPHRRPDVLRSVFASGFQPRNTQSLAARRVMRSGGGPIRARPTFTRQGDAVRRGRERRSAGSSRQDN